MSYDVRIGPHSFNYTYNLSIFFHDHIEGDDEGGINGLDGKTGAEAFSILSVALQRVELTYQRLGHNEIRRRYDAPNGWGSVIGAIIFMSRIMAACAEQPNQTVRVS